MGGVASGVLGGIGSVYQAVQGAKERREAQDALNHYKRQELTNVADGLQVSTLGSDLQREEQARLASGQVEALQEGGARTIVGGLGRVEANNQKVMRETGADLDMQQKNIDMLGAEDQARIRAMQENREQNDINALSSQLQSGKQDMYSGIGSGIQSVGMLGNAFGNRQPTYNPYQTQGVNQIQPAGTVAYKTNMQTTPYPTTQFGQFGQGMFGNANPYVNQQY